MMPLRAASGPGSLLVLVCGLLLASPVSAQDIEPRRWTHLPAGSTILGVGLGYSDGDIFFDPVLAVEDATLDLRSLGVSVVRSFGWLGRSARVDVTLPFAHGEWEGLLNGVPTSVVRQGFADPSIRLSMNFFGAPALRGREFQAFRASRRLHTTFGGALGVLVPVGEYRSDRLLNLGSNRWILRPQLGLLHERGSWQFEATGSVLLFEDNNSFYLDSVREQDPLWLLQGHVIYRFGPGWWAGVSGAYGWGGESTVNGLSKDDEGRVRYWGLSIGTSLGATQALKFAYVYSRTNTLTGSDLDSFALSWTVRLAP